VVEKDNNMPQQPQKEAPNESVGDDILKMLNERTANPGEAFVLLQQLAIFVWDQYRVDWKEVQEKDASSTRKQRYMEFVSNLVDTMHSQFESEQPPAK
jgi:hypothetical protein